MTRIAIARPEMAPGNRNRSPYDDAPAREIAEGFDLRALPDAFYDNPYPTYRALREHDPVHRCPDGSWFLTRYADVLAVYRDHRRMSSDKRVEFAPKFSDGALFDHHTTSLVFRDPPYHTRIRKLIHHFFTPRSLAAMEPRVVALVDGMLDRLADARRMDLITEFAFALPVEVVCDLLGVPRDDRSQLCDWAKAILGALEPTTSNEVLEVGNQSVRDFSGYLAELVRDKRSRGAEDEVDVLSLLVPALHGDGDGEEGEGRLTEFELIQNCIFFLNAGHETTTNLIGNGVNALLDHPGEAQRLRSEPGVIEPAVDEFLRFESSNQLGNRRALAPFSIGGTTLAAGSLVTICIGAANRDPVQFPDPDRPDLGRQPNRHVAFAAGIHTCAGAALARLEGRVAIGRLMARFPTIARDGPIERDRRARFRVVKRLPVCV